MQSTVVEKHHRSSAAIRGYGDDPLSWPPTGCSDRQLLERFVRSRDEGAFERLVRRHGPMVLGVCRRVLGRAEDAEDAFQATFLVLMRKAGVIAHPELLGNWLFGVASRIARKARAQIFRRRRVEQEAVPLAPAQELCDECRRETRAQLVRELARLPLRYREPLALCYLQGLTNKEAARRLGWPTGSISYRLARGRKLLRARLSDQHGDRGEGAGVSTSCKGPVTGILALDP
jgi:RNA polymerase sigma factor (sigma-70 family)